MILLVLIAATHAKADAGFVLYTRRFELDKKSESLTEDWNSNMGCSQRFDTFMYTYHEHC
jgi:hypothetical protein